MKTATNNQIIIIRATIAKNGIEEYKNELVNSFSNGRTTSTKELTTLEASDLIKHLNQHSSLNRMRNKVIALGYKVGILYGDTAEDKKMNMAKLDMFLRERGAVKKPLNSLNSSELVKVVSQFEQIEKNNGQSKHNKNLKGLLTELNIPTQKQ